MRLCFIIPGTSFPSYFLMSWTDLVTKCMQGGHQIYVSQQPTRQACFSQCKEDFDAYVCIDPEVVFTPENIFRLLESPHDVTGAVMMSSDLHNLTCGKTMEDMIHEHDNEYVEVDRIEPSMIVLHGIPEGWNFTDPVKGHIDTKTRVGHRITVTV